MFCMHSALSCQLVTNISCLKIFKSTISATKWWRSSLLIMQSWGFSPYTQNWCNWYWYNYIQWQNYCSLVTKVAHKHAVNMDCSVKQMHSIRIVYVSIWGNLTQLSIMLQVLFRSKMQWVFRWVATSLNNWIQWFLLSDWKLETTSFFLLQDFAARYLVAHKHFSRLAFKALDKFLQKEPSNFWRHGWKYLILAGIVSVRYWSLFPIFSSTNSGCRIGVANIRNRAILKTLVLFPTTFYVSFISTTKPRPCLFLTLYFNGPQWGSGKSGKRLKLFLYTPV